MRLALEGLGVVQPQRTIVDELIDQIHLIEAEDALRDSLEEVDVLLHTYHSLESIHQAIKQCGVTQSIVHLYGENFSSMENDQTAGAEKEVEEKKQGVLKRIWETLKRWFANLVAFFKSLFSRTKTIVTKLRYIKDHADEYELPITAYAPFGLTQAALRTEAERLFEERSSEEGTSLSDQMQLMDKIREELKDKYKLDENKKTTISSPEQLKSYVTVLIERFEDIDRMRDYVKSVSFKDADELKVSKVRIALVKMIHPIACQIVSKYLITVFYRLNANLKQRSKENE